MHLFDQAIDYSKDVFRNIRSIKISQDLFDDLSHDPLDWDAANCIEMYTHPTITHPPLIQRAFDYSKNNFIDYPFEHITASRYSDGSVACWYGSETLDTTIYETQHHFKQEILNTWELFRNEQAITVDRRVAKIACHGLAFDLSQKGKQFPWLIDSVNYTRCQEIGRRIAKEGHPLLRVPSARHQNGINLVAFSPNVLSNPRDYCRLQYVFDVATQDITIIQEGKG